MNTENKLAYIVIIILILFLITYVFYYIDKDTGYVRTIYARIKSYFVKQTKKVTFEQKK